MKKRTIAILVGIMCLTVTSSYAQQKNLVKGIIDATTSKVPSTVSAQLERQISKQLAAGKLPGIYVPEGMPVVRALEKRIAFLAREKELDISNREIRRISQSPERLLQFEEKVGVPVVKKSPLPYQEGLAVLRANQKKFSMARANNKYDKLWTEFIESRLRPFPDDYYLPDQVDLAQDIYKFYDNYIGFKDVPVVRVKDFSSEEALVLEIPVDGIFFYSAHALNEEVEAVPEEFVAIKYSDGVADIIPRYTLEANGDKGGYYPHYYVIK